MNWFTRIWNRITRPVDPEDVRVYSFGGRTTAGEAVDEDKALRQSVVWACVRYLSSSVAQLPWRLMQDLGDRREDRRTHPLWYVLNVRANPEMSAFSFRETMVGWAAIYGNAVAEIERDMRGVVTALWPVEPWRCSFKRNDAGRMYVEVSNETAAPRAIPMENLFHLRGYGNGPIGLNVVQLAAESIGWARATEVFGAAYFGQGMAPSGIFKTKGKLSPDGLKRFKEEVKKEFGGAKQSHRQLVLDVDMEFQQLAVDPTKLQLIETRQHQVEEVCRWFGVPPHKVMHLLRSTFSNIEHQSIEVVVDSLTPWVIRLEQEADYRLFGPRNREGLYTKLDLKGLMRGAYKDRQEGLQIMRRNGIINADEWRALEDMNPIGEEEGGDKFIVESNMTELEVVGEQMEMAAAGAPAPEAEEPEAEDPEEEDPEDNVIDALAWRRRMKA